LFANNPFTANHSVLPRIFFSSISAIQAAKGVNLKGFMLGITHPAAPVAIVAQSAYLLINPSPQ
jgi:hypothetical protein